jgi:hypothetical protein
MYIINTTKTKKYIHLGLEGKWVFNKKKNPL